MRSLWRHTLDVDTFGMYGKRKSLAILWYQLDVSEGFIFHHWKNSGNYLFGHSLKCISSILCHWYVENLKMAFKMAAKIGFWTKTTAIKCIKVAYKTQFIRIWDIGMFKGRGLKTLFNTFIEIMPILPSFGRPFWSDDYEAWEHHNLRLFCLANASKASPFDSN